MAANETTTGSTATLSAADITTIAAAAADATGITASREPRRKLPDSGPRQLPSLWNRIRV